MIKRNKLLLLGKKKIEIEGFSIYYSKYHPSCSNCYFYRKCFKLNLKDINLLDICTGITLYGPILFGKKPVAIYDKERKEFVY